MANINSVTISGNLTRDAEIKQSQSGRPVATFAVAVNDRIKGQDGEWTDYPNFIDCVAFGQLAEFAAPSLKKGAQVVVYGKLHQRKWEKDGEQRSRIEVTANEIVAPKSEKPKEPEQTYYDIDCPF